MTLLLSDSDIRRLISLPDIIRIIEQGFVDSTDTNLVMPQRLVIRLPGGSGLLALMPALVRDAGILGYKSATAIVDNALRNLPTVMSLILILDPASGQTLVIMDGSHVTEIRTAAASAVATRHLARPDSAVLGVLGSGVQAQAHIRSMTQVAPIREARVYSPNLLGKQADFAESLSDVAEVEVHSVMTPREAVADCDIVVLATSSAQPVIRYEWLSPGTHVNAVGSHSPTTREVDTDTLVNSRVVCDSIPACLHEAGDVLIPIQEQRYAADLLHASLGDVIRASSTGRQDDKEITLFKSVGLAVHDVLSGHYILQKAMACGIGAKFDFGR